MTDFSMLLINNNRSKAYLQNLISNHFIPQKVIVLNDKNTTLVEHTENDKIIDKNTKQRFYREIKELGIGFDEKEHILRTLEDNDIEYILLDTLDINSDVVVNEVAQLHSEFIIYSGPGGTILRKTILSQGKKFIHVHPGWLPSYRGSTTMYYSMLLRSEVGASVIIFEEGLDEGPILYRNKYEVHEKNIDLDYVLDPLVRAKALIEFMQEKLLEYIEQTETQDNSSTFYIIHPFLKHASIIKYNG